MRLVKIVFTFFKIPSQSIFTTNAVRARLPAKNHGISGHEEIVKRVDRAFVMLNMEDLKDRDIFYCPEKGKIAFAAGRFTLKWCG